MDVSGQKTTMWPFVPPQKRATGRDSPSVTPAPRSAGRSEAFPGRLWLEAINQRPPALRNEPRPATSRTWSLRIKGLVCWRPERWLRPLTSLTKVDQQALARGDPHQQTEHLTEASSEPTACRLPAGKPFPVYSSEGLRYPPLLKHFVYGFLIWSSNDLAEQ